MKVHSFDLIKLNDYVTVCDFAKVPLGKSNLQFKIPSVDGNHIKDN